VDLAIHESGCLVWFVVAAIRGSPPSGVVPKSGGVGVCEGEGDPPDGGGGGGLGGDAGVRPGGQQVGVAGVMLAVVVLVGWAVLEVEG